MTKRCLLTGWRTWRASRAKFNDPAGRGDGVIWGERPLSLRAELREVIYVLQRLCKDRIMSRKTGQTWQTGYYQFGGPNLKENVENVGVTQARVKDGNLEVSKSRQVLGVIGGGGPGKRTVLSSLTNRQSIAPSLPAKQVR